MTDIEKARERIAGLINSRYKNSNYREDMVQIALIEYANGSDIYQAIAKARREERKWSKPKRLYGEMSFDAMDRAGLKAVQAQDDLAKRKRTATIALIVIAGMATRHLAQLTGLSTGWCNVRKRQIRALLDLAPAKVGCQPIA